MGVRKVECEHKDVVPSCYTGWSEEIVLLCYNHAHRSSWLELYTHQKTAMAVKEVDCRQSQTVLADSVENADVLMNETLSRFVALLLRGVLQQVGI